MDPLNDIQKAAAAQFSRQSGEYGRKHMLADTSDVAWLLDEIPLAQESNALDVATGGGHTALYLARRGLSVTLGDLSHEMLEAASQLLLDEGFYCKLACFPAESMPFGDSSFDIVSSRVAPHHFSSIPSFVQEVARVLKPGGWFMLIDGSVPDNCEAADQWLNQVEKWRDPSHNRMLSPARWNDLVVKAGLTIEVSELHPLQQPDLEWYFSVAGTPPANRDLVRRAVREASPAIREAMQLAEDADTKKITWIWPMLRLLARKPAG